MVGTSGSNGERSLLVTPIARSLPALIWAIMAGMGGIIILTCPPSRSVIAGTRALVRDLLQLDPGGVCSISVPHGPGADARRRVVELAGLGLGVGDQLLHVFTGSDGCATSTRGCRRRADRREVLDRVVAEIGVESWD